MLPVSLGVKQKPIKRSIQPLTLPSLYPEHRRRLMHYFDVKPDNFC